MKVLLSIFLLFTMVSSVAVSILRQTHASIVCELEESQDDDDTNEAKEKESKTETEKDLIAYKKNISLTLDNLDTYRSRNNIPTIEDKMLSALYKFLPENPPEL